MFKSFVIVAFIILLFSSVSLATISSASTSYGPPSIVQFTSGYESGGSSTTVSLTFQKPVTQGDVIVVCAGIVSGNFIKISTSTLTDIRLINFDSIVRARTPIDTLAQAWYGVAKSSGPESITLSYNSGPAALFAYEISSSTLFGSSSKAHEGAATSGSSVNPYKPGLDSLVIACGGFFSLEGAGSVKANPLYTLDQSFTGNNAAEHVSGFTHASTESHFRFSNTLNTWSEVSVSFVGS